MIRFRCPGCAAVYAVDTAKGGRSGQCPGCGARFTIPGNEPSEPSSPPPPSDALAPIEVQPCPGCGVRLSVVPTDLGVNVECPYCQTVFAAARPGASRPTSRRRNEERPRPRRRWDNDDEAEDDDDVPARPSRRNAKPGTLSGIAVMLLVSGIFAFVWDLGMIAGSTGICCLWPGTYFAIVWGILAIIRGSTMLGQNDLTDTPRTLLILQIIMIINFDIVNCILGIIGLVLLNNPEVQDYYEGRRDDDD